MAPGCLCIPGPSASGLRDLGKGSTTDSVQLSSLSTPRVVYRFNGADSVTLYYRLNRQLARVPGGAIRLAQTTSASLVSFDAPWVTTPQASSLLASTSPSDNPACGTLSPVNASGTYCEVNVQIVPGVPADAFVGNGARFQSDPGHGQSYTIHVFFSEPVVSVEVTAYDPTFDGNTMTAKDSTGATISTVGFPGNGRPGVLSIQTGTVTGRIAEVVLDAPIGDYVNYSMKVQFSDPSCKVSVSNFGQAQLPWASDNYDHINKTIKQRGCALTSMAMGLSAFGVAVTPRDLNDQLKADATGYAIGGGIDWGEAVRVPSGGSVLFDRFTTQDEMKKALCKGRPVIVGVKIDAKGTPHHFVLATEAKADGTFQIMDPASGSGVSRPLSFYAPPYQIRGAIRGASAGASPSRSGVDGPRFSLMSAGLESDAGPSFVSVSAPGSRIDVTDVNGAHSTADQGVQTMNIPGSTAFVDAIDDDDSPFEVDTTSNMSVSVPLGGTYAAQLIPKYTGPLNIFVQATTPSGVQTGTTLVAAARAGIPLGIDIVTTAGQATAVGSPVGYVSVNRSCGATHIVTNANSLPLDLTYGVEGQSPEGTLHIDANSSVMLSLLTKGRIILYSLGRQVYRADVPPGCQ